MNVVVLRSSHSTNKSWMRQAGSMLIPIFLSISGYAPFRPAAVALSAMPFASVEPSPPPAPWTTNRVNIVDFGGKGDGKSDNTDAFNDAVAAATPKALTVYLPAGTYRFASRPKPIGSGVRFVGAGSVGSTPGFGTYLIADYDEKNGEVGFLSWDGSYGNNAGTGGGVQDLVIYKSSGHHGGTAIKLTGVDDNHRAGFTTISDILVSGAQPSGTWDHILVIDGSCCETAHSQGVRDIYINNFWGANSTAPGESVVLNNAVQVFWHGGEIFPAGGGQSTGITLDGGPTMYSKSTNVFFSDVYVAGSFFVKNARTVSYSGYIGENVAIGSEATDIYIAGIVGGNIMNASATTSFTTTKLNTVSSEGLMYAGQKPVGISSGDVAASRGPDTGMYWFGSDGRGYIYRDTSDEIKVSLPFIVTAVRTGQKANSDLAGQLTLREGKAVYHFSASYADEPICTATDISAPNPVMVSTTIVDLTVSGVGSDKINYECIGRK
jgi:Pectate lyase superfamily protein